METLSLAEARRIALAAQGFDRPRPRRVTVREITRTIRQLGLVQIDFVNVLVPAQYQVPFSRLGAYKRALFDEVVYHSGEFTEQWAHEASIVPMETWPLLRDRMQTHRVRPWPFAKILEEQAEYAAWMVEEVRLRGPLTAADFPVPKGLARRIPGSWISSVQRAFLEAHFGRGVMAVTERQRDFSRVYELAERVIPRQHFQKDLAREAAHRELVRTAAVAYGVATAPDLADYYRMSMRDVRPRISELVEAGELREIRVEGWRERAWLHRDAAPPARITAAALLSPFDPVVWYRPRALRLFGFDYRIEIWVPREKRKWGYYVLPFLLGDRLVARVDLKSDRDRRTLRVLAAYIERGEGPARTADALARELKTMAAWLDLGSVTVERKGNLARELATALRCALGR